MRRGGPYPVRSNVDATMFWVGEQGNRDNADISNSSSVWGDNWQGEFGGVDDPNRRCEIYFPCFAYHENPFYFALPFNDLTDSGKPKPTSQLKRIYWYDGRPPASGTSLIKNHWIKVSTGTKVAYAQWEDAGPFKEDDVDYVFGTKRPQNHAGLDLSPATAIYVGLSGESTVSWQFVNPDEVPPGPWRQEITSSGVE